MNASSLPSLISFGGGTHDANTDAINSNRYYSSPSSASEQLFPGWSNADIYTFLLKQYNYADGGAFAEIHVPQFPGGVGLNTVVTAPSAAAVAKREEAVLIANSNTFSSGSSGRGGVLLIAQRGGGGQQSGDRNQTSAATATASPSSPPPPLDTSTAPSTTTNNPFALAVIPDSSRMSTHEEQLLRGAQGGLLVVHTPESALTTKTFTAEELRKPADEVISENLEKTRAAIQGILADQMTGTVGGGKGGTSGGASMTSLSSAQSAAPSTTAPSTRVRKSGGDAANPFLPNAIAAKQQAKQHLGKRATDATSASPTTATANKNNSTITTFNAVAAGASTSSPPPTSSSALAIIVPTAAAYFTNERNTSTVASAYRSDPAPVLRSPTKRQALQFSANGEAATLFGGGSSSSSVATTAGPSGSSAVKKPFGVGLGGGLPAVVNNYKNKKGIIFSLDQRTAAQGPTATTEVVELNQRHFDVAKALNRAQKEHEAAAVANAKAGEEAERRLRERAEKEATRKALEVLEKRAAEAVGAVGGAADNATSSVATANDSSASLLPLPLPQGTLLSNPTSFLPAVGGAPLSTVPTMRETREQRAARIVAERQAREEEQEEERREKRLAKTAARLGISREALEGDASLMAAVNDGFVSNVGGGGALGSSSTFVDGVEVDPRVLVLANSNRSMRGVEDISVLLHGGGPSPSTISGGAGVSGQGSPALHHIVHSNTRIQEEMRRLEEAEKAGRGGFVSGGRRQRGGALCDEESSDDDDVFGLKKKHHRAQ